MLEIGLHGLAFALTALVIAALKKGGKNLPSPAALAAGIALGYAYSRTGEPWSILADKAKQLTASLGDEFGAAPAAVALAIGAWWHYTRPGPLGSLVQGILLISAASAASGLMPKAVSIVGSLITVIAG